MAVNEAATKWVEAKLTKKGKHGVLEKILDEINETYKLEGKDRLNKHTVRSREKQGRNVLVTSTGPVPCTLTLEPFFVETFLKLAAMRQPLTATEALEFMNATIKNTSYEKEVAEWKNTIKETKKDGPHWGKNTGDDF